MTMPVQTSLAAPAQDRTQVLRAQSKALETAFLAEMLGHAGFGAARDSFGGGAGEDQFASFLRNEQATLMVEKGGIGLAETLFRALSARDGRAETEVPHDA